MSCTDEILGKGSAEDRDYQRRERVANAQRFTLYSFAPDTATASKCTGPARRSGRR
jgi:predicted lipoprotein with Yx(FWY)xxD motif